MIFDETIRTRLAGNNSKVGNTELAMHAQFPVGKIIRSLVIGIAIDEAARQ